MAQVTGRGVATQGLSKKLYPSLVGILTGLVVALAVDKETGLSILITAVASLGLGYVAPADHQRTVQQ